MPITPSPQNAPIQKETRTSEAAPENGIVWVEHDLASSSLLTLVSPVILFLSPCPWEIGSRPEGWVGDVLGSIDGRAAWHQLGTCAGIEERGSRG